MKPLYDVVRLVGPVIILCMLLVEEKTYASDTPTNDPIRAITDSTTTRLLDIEWTNDRETFFDHLRWQIPRQGQRAATLELGNSADFALFREWMRESYGRDRIRGRGENVFEDTLLRSLRDSFVDWLDIDRFKDQDRPARYTGAKFLEGTIGGTLEESRRDALSLDPDDIEISQSWIDSFTQNNQIQYGIQWFDDNPYGYLSIAVGTRRGKPPLFIINNRIHSMLLKDGDETVMPRNKTEILIPIGRRTHLSLGTSSYPTRFNRSGYENEYAAKITTRWKGINPYASIHTIENGPPAAIGFWMSF